MISIFLLGLIVPLVGSSIADLPQGSPVRAAMLTGEPAALSLLSEPVPPPTQSTAVTRLYRASCLKCHDTDGKGEIVRDVLAKIPDFTNSAWQSSRSDADLKRSILEGKGKSMPSMRGKLGSVDVGQMVAFVRGFGGGTQVVNEDEEKSAEPQLPVEPQITTRPGSPAAVSTQPVSRDLSLLEGRRLFQRPCITCHGNDGRGAAMRDTLPSIPDFTAGRWQETRTDFQLVVSVMDGKGDGMPPFRDKVSREQARDIVAFIRTLGPSPAMERQTHSNDFETRFQQLLSEFENLRRRSRALSADGAAIQGGQPQSSTSPHAQPAGRIEPQSSGGGRREGGG
jgi:mono/diheme cytochrome c family protein